MNHDYGDGRRKTVRERAQEAYQRVQAEGQAQPLLGRSLGDVIKNLLEITPPEQAAVRDGLRWLAGQVERLTGPDLPPEPSTPPAQPSADSRAAAGPPLGTLDGPGVLGRALLDEHGHLARRVGPNLWQCGTHTPQPRARIESAHDGPVREVLLVDQDDWQRRERLAQAARAWLSTYERGQTDANLAALQAVDAALAAAVDALDRPTGEWRCARCGTTIGGGFRHADGTLICSTCQHPDPAEPAPESAGDGPGWDRCGVYHAIDMIDAASHDPNDGLFTVNMVQDLRALLADRDRWAKVSGEWADETIAARAELAEVTADRDRYREHSTTLNTVGWKLTEALCEIPLGADQVQGNPLEQAERLIAEYDRLSRELAADRHLTADRDLTAELATARQGGAADALWAAAKHYADDQDRRKISLNELVRGLGQWAADIRRGTRPVSGTPEPASGSGEEQA